MISSRNVGKSRVNFSRSVSHEAISLRGYWKGGACSAWEFATTVDDGPTNSATSTVKKIVAKKRPSRPTWSVTLSCSKKALVIRFRQSLVDRANKDTAATMPGM